MTRWLSSLFVLASLAAVALGAAPDEAKVQGNYQGTWKGAGEEGGKAEAKVIAEGGGKFRAELTRHLDKGETKAVTLQGQVKGDGVAFQGKAGQTTCTADHKDGAISGKCGEVALSLQRVVKEPPSLGKKPPEGAVVLLDGKNFDKVTKRNAREPWKLVEGGGVRVPRGGIRTKQAFEGAFDCHLEFMCNFRPAARGQGRGNSGFYLPNGTEIQILDNFGFPPYRGSCGALYGQSPPDVNASLPPLQWQTYDVEYRTQSRKGKSTGRPWVTVYHNGIKIHDDVELRGRLRGGTFFLQDHGNPVCFRNFWVLPIKED